VGNTGFFQVSTVHCTKLLIDLILIKIWQTLLLLHLRDDDAK
jgi:hypothetical protein